MGCNCSNLGGANVNAGDNNKSTEHLMTELTSSYYAVRSLIPELRSSANTLPTLEKPVLNNQTLLFLAANHLKVAVSTMNLLDCVKLALARARKRQAILLQALSCYQKEQSKSPKKYYSQTISKLKDFKEAGDPFAALLSGEFALLCQKQRSMFRELSSKKEKLRERTRSTKRWKKACKVISSIVFVSMLISSVVLSAVAAPPLATVAVAALGAAIKTAEQWADSVCDGRLGVLEKEKEVALMMIKGEFWGHEVESVRAMVRRLEIRMGSIEGDAVFAVERGEEEVAVEVAMEVMEGKVGEVEEWIEGVEMKVEACEGEVKKVVALFLDAITN